jgi:gluconolactonase
MTLLDLDPAVTQLVKVADVDAHEGPVFVESSLYFTTLPKHDMRGFPQVEIKRLLLDGLSATGVVTLRESANAANGMTLAPDGRLLVCEQGSLTEPARLSLVDRQTGAAEAVVDAPLNSPNDVVVRSDGTIWFTDPSYGYLQGFRPEPKLGDCVYRYDPACGSLTVAAAGLDKPNGLAFSPDESTLYVGDNGAPKELIAFDLEEDARLTARRDLATSAGDHPDGIKVDAAGRIYASSPAGVDVFSPEGDRVGGIDLPGAVNFTFGGPEGNVLYITADTAIWAAVLDAKGACT